MFSPRFPEKKTELNKAQPFTFWRARWTLLESRDQVTGAEGAHSPEIATPARPPIPSTKPIMKPKKNPTHPGYQGLWFDLRQHNEYGSKYSGGLATYTAKHKPLAIYSAEADKTFFVYGGTSGPNDRYLLCMIGAYDHAKGELESPRVVYDKEGVDDPHDNPSLAMDEYGHLWVFVSGRGKLRPGHIFKSSAPYSIEHFDLIKSMEFTYPQPHWVEGRGFIHLFTKYTKGRELYYSKSQDGENWTPDRKIAALGGHYMTHEIHGERIAIAFNRHPGGDVDQRTDLYYLESPDMGETWTTADGQPAKLPISNNDDPARIRNYSDEGRLVYMKDLNFDHHGNPVILCVTSSDSHPGPQGDPRNWEIAHWNGSNWDFHTITQSTHNYDTGSLYVEGNLWRVFAPTERGPQEWGQGGEIAIWESNDAGASWSKTKQVTSNSERNQSYVRRPVNAHPDFYTFWCDGSPDQLSEVHLYFTDRNGKKVTAMPYYAQVLADSKI